MPIKETFIVRTEWFDAIKELELEDQATILLNLFYFHNGEENLINLNNLSVKLVWKLIEPNLQRNIDIYDKRKDTSSENGKLGGRPLKTKDINNLNNLNGKPNKPKKPIESLSVPVSVSDIINNNSEPEIPFNEFWDAYDKKIDLAACKRKWDKLPLNERKIILEHVARYKLSQPDKQYRKNPETYLNNRSWENEIITPPEKEKVATVFTQGRALT